MTSSKHAFLILIFVLAQAILAAHAFECADEADHEGHFCQICHLAERDGDALAPVQFSHGTCANITVLSSLFVTELVSEKKVGSANPRAPPLI